MEQQKYPTMKNRLPEIGPQQRRGIPAGICSICSSGSMVLETGLAHAARNNSDLIIESTCNQVNQYGGYAGMTPRDFASYIRGLARKNGFPEERLLIGGDHLGPYPWRRETANTAMDKARKLVTDCVSAGYGKIHLDCGMPIGDDGVDTDAVAPELSAKRTAALCKAAESTRSDVQRKQGLPLYVIGAEAPTPGGSLTNARDVPVTEPEEISRFLDICKTLFRTEGLDDAWQRVVAIVVQPGIDFGPDSFVAYNPDRNRALSAFHDRLAGRMTYEVHATDFQSGPSLSKMVEDHFALLKTGPVLTFAFREAVFALARIEEERLKGRKSADPSDIIRVIDREMTASPEHWRSHVREDSEDVRVLRIYGLTDRVRYYWNYPAVSKAFALLINNLARPIPLGLVSQYFPEAFHAVIDDKLPAEPLFLIRHRIVEALHPYITACSGKR